ncbi:hypothetical protein HUU05_29020 [candidate division KSB1 bacterium]|nr:hypothetical protein [candidate division KSB1 bacterium]
MLLELTPQELATTQRIVRQYFMNLRAEIYRTDSSIFKDGLKEEEAELELLLRKLESSSARPAAVY